MIKKKQTLDMTDSKKETLAQSIVRILDDGKAKDIVAIDLRGKTSLTDDLIIATGTSSRHVIALADTLSKKLKKLGYASKIEGKDGSGEWVVLDLGDAIVHLFCARTRQLYEIETLWGYKTPKSTE